jgi:hypothetical protein
MSFCPSPILDLLHTFLVSMQRAKKCVPRLFFFSLLSFQGVTIDTLGEPRGLLFVLLHNN